MMKSAPVYLKTALLHMTETIIKQNTATPQQSKTQEDKYLSQKQ